jgi:hypothetical protein
MGGFLVVGLVVVLVAAIANIFFAVPAVSLAISAAIVFIMSGFILFDTSRIIHGGETNYIRATVSLYLNIYNLFTSILHLLGAFGGDDKHPLTGVFLFVCQNFQYLLLRPPFMVIALCAHSRLLMA